MVFVLCCISFWSTAVIANIDEQKASQIITLWPKDGTSLGGTGMGTPKPDRGDGYIRLTDVTKPSMRYFGSRYEEAWTRGHFMSRGGYSHLVTTKMKPIAMWLNQHGASAFILIYRTPRSVKMPLRIFSERSGLSAHGHQSGT